MQIIVKEIDCIRESSLKNDVPQVRQLGLPRDELSKFMVRELELSCTPQQYLDETYEFHKKTFSIGKGPFKFKGDK